MDSDTSPSSPPMSHTEQERQSSMDYDPPTPPLLLPPPAPAAPAPAPVAAKADEIPALRVVSGNLTTALRASHRASRWLLVILDYASELPFRLSAPVAITSTVNGWRPRKDSTFAESYTAFFPASANLHVALLDPRSGERLHVWGEPSGEDTDDAEAVLWDEVLNALHNFVAQHAVDGFQLGPYHHRDKPWAASTRRDSPAVSALPPTSAMDDEDSAIAAAIAASLAEANKEEDEDEYEFDDYDQDDDEEDEDDDMDTAETDEVDTASSSPPPSADIADSDVGLTAVPERLAAVPIPGTGSWADVASVDIAADVTQSPSDVVPGACTAAPRDAPTPRSIPVPRRLPPASAPLRPRVGSAVSPAPGPSSVESLASSYMERLHSRYRSAHDPALAERRALRSEQDAELAASLEADRRKDELRRAEQRAARQKAEARDAARARLPHEPAPPAPSVTVALRLPDGSRVMRAFPPSAPLSAVADLCHASGGLAIVERPPAQVLWSRAPLEPDAMWTATLEHVCKAQRRILFHVQTV